jgi:phenylalanyl-tRNA synthetase beta chain
MRPTLLPGLLESLAHNINRQQSQVRLFEFGARYRRHEAGSYSEQPTLALVMTGQAYEQSWLQPAQRLVSVYDLLSVLQALAQQLSLPPFDITEATDGLGLVSAVHINLRGKQVGCAGRVAQKLARKYEVRQIVWAAELNWAQLVKMAAPTQVKFQEIGKFPTVYRDLALILEKNTKFADVHKVVRKAGKPFIRDARLFDVFTDNEKLGEGFKSYALSLSFESTERTLQDTDMEQLMSRIEKALSDQCGATVRRG